MNQTQSQSREYWVSDFEITESDIEQIYNYFLEVEKPQPVNAVAKVIIAHRVAEERNRIEQLLSGRIVYQPKDKHEVGDKLVFPALRYAQGSVLSTREGYDPAYGHYDVITVEIDAKEREFASALPGHHELNLEDGTSFDPMAEVEVDELFDQFGPFVESAIADALESRTEFVRLADQWFVKGLMSEVTIGHLHLAEAVLEVNEGGPLPTDEILLHLDLDEGVETETRQFSLNYALSEDERFDEVGQPGQVSWFLRRLEPESVRVVPERLRCSPLSYDRALLSPQLMLLERELDDEWSELEPVQDVQPTILSLTYPHRWAGTLPLSSRTRPLFPTGISQRQRVILRDEHSGDELNAWVVREDRYIYGLAEWYEENKLPVGGFVTLKPGPETGVVLLDYDRRRPKREWIRLATVENNEINFELERRSVGCGYDELLIVGTDYVAAVDALSRRLEANKRSLTDLLVNIFPKLAKLNPQETVHTKTLYSAINMLRRVAPGPIFAALIKHPAFQPVGDHYWQYDGSRAR